MNDKPYFPPLFGEVDCYQCEMRADCRCFDKYQRNRRDFTHTSGRCPRLPDKRGFVAEKEMKLYAATFPLIHAERGAGGSLDLTLTLAGEKRNRKVYRTKCGYWYYRTKSPDGFPAKQMLVIYEGDDKERILNHMERVHADYCIFRCEIRDCYV